MEDELGVVKLVTGIFCIMVSGVILLYANNLALRGRAPRREARRWDVIYILSVSILQALLLVIKTSRIFTRSLVRLVIRSPDVVSAASDADIPPSALAPPLQPQLSTLQEELQSQQSTAQEEFQPNQTTIKDQLLLQQSTSLHSATEGEFQSQCSAAKEDAQSQQVATEEEIRSPQSATERHSNDAINIWSTCSLQQYLRNSKDYFKVMNHPIQFEAVDTPHGSSCSSPRHFEYTHGVPPVIEYTDDLYHQFKSLILLDQGSNLIDQKSLSRLVDMILKQMRRPGHQQILYNFFEHNSYVLDRFLCDHFNLAGLSIDAWTCIDAFQFTYESAKRCVMNFKVMGGLLYLMKRELDEVKCESFHQDLKDYYFMLCVRKPIQNLIDAADSISKLKLSSSDIYQMLVLYEAIHDVLYNGTFGNPNEYGRHRIFQQMRVNFKGIFDEIESFICAKLNGSPCKMIHVGHPVTDFLVQSMKLFVNHMSIVGLISSGDVTCSLDHLLSKVISYWEKELKRHSDSYDVGGNYIFLLNNLALFIQHTEEIKVLMANSGFDEIIKLLESLINNYTAEYLEKCWGPVRNCLKLIPGRKPCLSSLEAFTSQFDSIYNCQRNWVLENGIKGSLREEIKQYITPDYCTFVEKLRRRRLLRAKITCQKYLSCQKYKTIKKLTHDVENIFESEHRDESRLCSCVDSSM